MSERAYSLSISVCHSLSWRSNDTHTHNQLSISMLLDHSTIARLQFACRSHKERTTAHEWFSNILNRSFVGIKAIDYTVDISLVAIGRLKSPQFCIRKQFHTSCSNGQC